MVSISHWLQTACVALGSTATGCCTEINVVLWVVLLGALLGVLLGALLDPVLGGVLGDVLVGVLLGVVLPTTRMLYSSSGRLLSTKHLITASAGRP